MASGVDSETVGDNTRWYCHSCDSEIRPSLPDFVCSQCNDGFIEPIEVDGNEQMHNEQSPADTGPVRVGSWPQGPPQNGGRRHTRVTIHRVGNGGPNPFQDFLQQFIGGLMGGNLPQGHINIQFPQLSGQNMGDYVFTAGGLDNVITMLLNQLDHTGPPPAQKDEIDALPVIMITQDQVDASLQCNVCMEDYQVDEVVRSLPCKHVFHTDCIVPWLQLHGTCPICRKTLDMRMPLSQSTDIPPD